MSLKKNNATRVAHIKKNMRAQASIDRENYFANGGEASRWRGLRLVTTDKKKKTNKRACRGRMWT